MNINYHIYKHAWIFNGGPHNEHQLSEEEAQELLHSGGWLVRNTYDFDCKSQTDFWYIICDRYNGIQELNTKTRNQIRKGRANYSIRHVSKEEIRNEGYPIHVAAVVAYKVLAQAPSREAFEQRIMTADDHMDFWGAFNNDNKMVAFAINKISYDHCDYQTLKAIPQDMKNYVYYALIDEMNQYYLNEQKLNYVMDGARSITEHSNIQPFLEEKFHFRKAYCHLHIYYTWWLKILITCLYPFRKLVRHNAIHALLMMHGMQDKTK